MEVREHLRHVRVFSRTRSTVPGHTADAFMLSTLLSHHTAITPPAIISQDDCSNSIFAGLSAPVPKSTAGTTVVCFCCGRNMPDANSFIGRTQENQRANTTVFLFYLASRVRCPEVISNAGRVYAPLRIHSRTALHSDTVVNEIVTAGWSWVMS